MPETQIKKIVESELQENNATNTMNSSHGKSQNQQKRQKKKRPFKKKVKIILRLIVVFALLLIASWKILTHSPQYKKLQSKTYDILAGMDKGTFRKGENTVFYDKDGNKIGEVDSGSYEYVEISKIPLDLQNAYIAAEDQQFKTHHGVNYFSTFRAGVEYLMHKDQITRGGSTITQQVIKNNLLTQEQTVTRKILELSLAPQLEKKYTKQDIMEFYCNSNYYGNGCYGVQSASRFYFGKDVSDLNTAECAMLAGISNSPNNYNPVANKDAAIRKEKIILKLMKECGMIKEEEYKTEKAREINVVGTEAEVQGINNYMCSYAMNCAVKHIMKEEGFEFKYLFDSDEECDQYWKDYQEKYNTISSEILAGGYKIYTSFDSNLQNQVQGIVDNTLSGYQDTVDGKYNQQAAVVTIDNDTGMITSIVGGRGTSDEFNRGFLAKRQPGSSIKPLLVYTPAFDKGIINPSSVLNDEKIYADDGNTSSFSPKNAYYGYKGAITARDALAMSTNTIAFKLLKDLGIDTGLNYLKEMNFTTLDPADYSAPSIALGGLTNGVTVVEMAKGYATLANKGKYIDKDCIIKIESDEKKYDFSKVKEKKVYSADAAFMMTDMMEGVFKKTVGTAYGVAVDHQIVAGKTGTTNDDKDVWMCGYSVYDTAAVWVGNDDNTSLYDPSLAKEIWRQVMNAASAGKERKDFDVPDTVEYRNIVSGGSLGDTVYNKKQLDMSKDSYDRRPDGYDYYSTLNAKEAEKYQKEKAEKEAIAAGEKAVTDFEAFQISTIDDANNLEANYANATNIVENVSTKSTKKEYLRRIEKHYKALKKAYNKTWKARIKEQQEENSKQQEADAMAKTEESNLAAEQSLHDWRIDNMNWYLKKLQEREYNTETAQLLITDAKNCLANCEGYDEYNSLKKQLDAQVSRISSLPTEIPHGKSENDADETPDSSKYPDDTDTSQDTSQDTSDPSQNDSNTEKEDQ